MNKPKGSKQSAWLIVLAVGASVIAVVVVAVLLLRPSDEKATSAVPPTVAVSPPTRVCDDTSPPALPARMARTKPYPMTIRPDASYQAHISTSCGTLLIKLFPKEAPIAVNNFVHLAEDHFYNGQVFHRIDPTLGIIQTGDPTCPTSIDTCGSGGPGYTIKDEFDNGLRWGAGMVAMASAGKPNSSGSQFEIVAKKTDTRLPGKRTLFGKLVGRHSYQVARLILSVPTTVAPNKPPAAPPDYPDGEFVYIKGVKIE